MINPALLLMCVINLRMLFLLPAVLFVVILLFIQSRSVNQRRKRNHLNGQIGQKQLVVWICLLSVLLLFTYNRCWEGISFSENGGYEAIAPIVCLLTCLVCQRLNGGWSFNKKDVEMTMPVLGIIFGIDLLLRLSVVSDLSLYSVMGEFKYGGLFPTSNVAGYLACTCLILSKQISRGGGVLFWFVIIIFTASRTSIAAAAFCVMALDKVGRIKNLSYLVFGGIISGVTVYFTNVNWSFESKLLIVERFLDVISNNSTQDALFGTDGGRLEVWRKLDVDADGTLLSPHNPFIKMVLYYGLIGGGCLIAFLIKSNRPIAVMYLLHCVSGIVPFFSIMYFDVISDDKYFEERKGLL
jgi:hypothetical protein